MAILEFDPYAKVIRFAWQARSISQICLAYAHPKFLLRRAVSVCHSLHTRNCHLMQISLLQFFKIFQIFSLCDFFCKIFQKCDVYNCPKIKKKSIETTWLKKCIWLMRLFPRTKTRIRQATSVMGWVFELPLEILQFDQCILFFWLTVFLSVRILTFKVYSKSKATFVTRYKWLAK